MPAPSAARFTARPLTSLIDELADALSWPRSRPVRVLAGERAAQVARFVICTDEAVLAGLDAPADTGVLLATPPATSDGRLGRRIYDPFAGTPEDVASWRRADSAESCAVVTAISASANSACDRDAAISGSRAA